MPVHPRGHGEHWKPPKPAPPACGSSPWARGTRNVRIRHDTGNAVHPRGHGEHSLKTSKQWSRPGSSPWARGTRQSARRAIPWCRFIPVGTGNTCWHAVVSCSETVHPRGHGEHCLASSCSIFNAGSSPWARGTRALKFRPDIISRFIPVGTGNTLAL